MPENQKPIQKNEGVTPAERYLKRICDKTFLSLWSYPSVFRDQKDSNNPEGKELCDVLVVFGNDIVIFSDKDVSFPRTHDLKLDWQRWYRRAILDSAKQAWGAERWITNFPSRIYLDRKCGHPFPIRLPDSKNMRVHIVLVCHNVSERLHQELRSSRGSMVLYCNMPECRAEPFMISDLNPQKSFIHVFDDTNLDILLSTIDTVSDFVEYLTKRSQFFRRGFRFIIPGEENLLAYYLLNYESEGGHSFDFVEKQKILMIEESMWIQFQNSNKRKHQIIANKMSYFWDNLIETFNENVLAGTQYDFDYTSIEKAEKALRVMAAESRTHRRILSRAFIELIEKSDSIKVNKRLVLPINSQTPYYVFLLYPRSSGISEREYRIRRHNELYANCLSLKFRIPQADYILGIAVEPKPNFGKSEDLLYLDVTNWSQEAQNDALKLIRIHGIPETLPEQELRSEKEYPVFKSGKDEPGRNEICPCGSGKKYKRCHGKNL